jgi:hypothetical protein
MLCGSAHTTTVCGARASFRSMLDHDPRPPTASATRSAHRLGLRLRAAAMGQAVRVTTVAQYSTDTVYVTFTFR